MRYIAKTLRRHCRTISQCFLKNLLPVLLHMLMSQIGSNALSTMGEVGGG